MWMDNSEQIKPEDRIKVKKKYKKNPSKKNPT